jgi:hypothetical protein
MKVQSKIQKSWGDFIKEGINKYYYDTYRVDFIHSTNMYSGYLEGGPTVADNDRHIKRIVELSEKLCWLKPFIYTGNVDLTKVLPYRANIAWINDMDRHMCLIWFDDGSLDCLKSLGEIIDNIDWIKNSKEFDF